MEFLAFLKAKWDHGERSKESDGNHQSTDLALTRSPLPTEILIKILNQLADDKHTLSRCMRVSPEFNTITAPVLYRSIRLNPKTAQIFELPISGKPFGKKSEAEAFFKLLRVRKTKPKSHNLAYIQEMTYTRGEECSTAGPKLPKCGLHKLEIPVLRLDGACGYSCVDNCCLLCVYGDSISPVKMVCGSSYYHPPLCPSRHRRNISLSRTKTFVAVYKDLYNNPHVQVLWSSADHLRTIVLIFLPTAFLSTDPNYSGVAQLVMRCDYMRHNLSSIARRFPNAIEILFVNFKDHVDNTSHPDDRRDGSQAVAADRIGPQAYLNALSRNPILDLSNEEARRITCKFVDMRTYLARYDWKGELTDEQVKPWLEKAGEEGTGTIGDMI